MQKVLTFFSAKNITVYTIFNDQSFNDTLPNVSFEQLGQDKQNHILKLRMSFTCTGLSFLLECKVTSAY